VDLYDKGLIYRGKRMVNWDPSARTALSDEEVIMTEEKGHLWHFKYPIAGSNGHPVEGQYVVVATTRPETMLGDEAVAVHPNDERYKHLIGTKVVLPLRNKLIPIICDELVDPKFGTGCVKVTPAHDPADYQMSQRHRLPITVVIAPDGTMSAEAGPEFAGLDRMEARKKVVEKLEAQELLLKVEDYVHNVGHSERSGVPIEPYLSEQWFLKYPSAAQSTEAVVKGEIAFHPERWSKTYTHWMENIKDWCISRQLWWGHRIPVWYKKGTGEIFCGLEAPKDIENWTQDPDVLDTWFSSWLWPFATMGWPDKTDTLKKFYPTTDLVTGPDIIFFWVARMIMAGYEFMGEKPFSNVYFTGIIRDKQGRKMSKSLGNSPDPLDLIAKFGADALRFGVMRSAPLGQDVLFDEQQVELGRNFCNKLWNACRYRQMLGGEVEGEINPALLTSDDKWILLRLDVAITEVTDALNQYKFNEAAQILYRFFWSEYCDWYLEATKAVSYGDNAAQKTNTLAVIDFILSNTLRLFHPFLPFITEELWHGLGYHNDMPEAQGGKTIMHAPWPKPLGKDFCEAYNLKESDAQFMEQRNGLVVQGRDLRRFGNIQAGKKVKFILKPAGVLADHDIAAMKILLNAETLELNAAYAPKKGTPNTQSPLGELFLPLDGLIDVDAEKARLTKELAKVQSEIDKVQQKLANPAFVQKVPASVLDEHKKRLADWQSKFEQHKNALESL
jgi:valyl-tRNA synthetase